MKPLAASILSLSLLTVMAGAAVAPALEVIRRHFSDASQLEVQLVVCMPALFIVITNMFFGRLASRFGARTLTMVGLALYTVGGAAAGLFNSIWAVLVMRALVGVGVGIIMPLSTGLLTYYFAPEKREGLMGLSSAANQLGGVVATLLAGVLANISWRLSFLVYLMGLISIVLCLIFMPNDRIRSVESSGAEKGGSGGVWRRNWGYILCMFLLMTAFFIYPANFAIVTAAEGAIPMSLCAVIMAGTDLVAFGGGLAFVWVKRVSGKCARLVAPLLFLIGYCLLACLERVSAMLLHISLSVFVFAAARSRAKRGYLAFAIGLHAIFDMPAALYQFGYVKQLFPVELWLAVCALYALRSARKCYLEECDA